MMHRSRICVLHTFNFHFFVSSLYFVAVLYESMQVNMNEMKWDKGEKNDDNKSYDKAASIITPNSKRNKHTIYREKERERKNGIKNTTGPRQKNQNKTPQNKNKNISLNRFNDQNICIKYLHNYGLILNVVCNELMYDERVRARESTCWIFNSNVNNDVNKSDTKRTISPSYFVCLFSS